MFAGAVGGGTGVQNDHLEPVVHLHLPVLSDEQALGRHQLPCDEGDVIADVGVGWSLTHI